MTVEQSTIDLVKQCVENACDVTVYDVVLDLDTTSYPEGDRYMAWLHVYYRRDDIAYKSISLAERIDEQITDETMVRFLIDNVIGNIGRKG